MISPVSLISSPPTNQLCSLKGGRVWPLIIFPARLCRRGDSQYVRNIRIINTVRKGKCVAEYDKPEMLNKLIRIIIANTRSILWRAGKTSFPMPKPIGLVRQGVPNFNHDSMKLIAPKKPHQVKIQAMAMDVVSVILKKWGSRVVFVIIYF